MRRTVRLLSALALGGVVLGFCASAALAEPSAEVSPSSTHPGGSVTVSVTCDPTGGPAPATLDATSQAFEEGTVALHRIGGKEDGAHGPAYRGTARIASAAELEGGVDSVGPDTAWTVDGTCPAAPGGQGKQWSATFTVAKEGGASRRPCPPEPHRESCPPAEGRARRCGGRLHRLRARAGRRWGADRGRGGRCRVPAAAQQGADGGHLSGVRRVRGSQEGVRVARRVPESHGPVRYGPPLPGDGLPVLPELSAVLAAAAGRAESEPVGGGAALLDAACGHFDRRGLSAEPDRVVAAPGAPALLLALTAALGGDVLVPRPCAAWWAPYARLLGRPVFHVATPAECGGVPDPYALLETVRRVRAEGGDPRLLVLSVADDPTATVAPPEVMHETVEAAAAEGLHLVSDETWRDTRHDPHESVLLSPAEMLPERVTVVTDLAGALLPLYKRQASGRACTRACSMCSPRSAPGWRARSPPRPDTPSPSPDPSGPARRPPSGSTRAWPPPCTRRSSPREPSPGPRRPAGICTSTSARCAPPSARTASVTPRTWRSSSPPGSACPRPAATVSATTSPHRAYGCPPGTCWAVRTRSVRNAWAHPRPGNCPMYGVRCSM